jgi:hypothetical protein
MWHVLTAVAMATDKHVTMGNHATVEAFSLWSVPVMMSLGSVFFVVCSRAILPWAPASQFSLQSLKVAVSGESSAEE